MIVCVCVSVQYLACGRRSAVLCLAAGRLKPHPPPAERESDSPNNRNTNRISLLYKFDV